MKVKCSRWRLVIDIPAFYSLVTDSGNPVTPYGCGEVILDLLHGLI